MKLTIMKLICLLVLLGGIFILCLVFDVEQAQLARDYVLNLWPTQGDGTLNLRLPGIVIGVIFIVIGGYGFIPRLGGRSSKSITYTSEQGDVNVELKPVRKTLLKVMRKMPEVYSIKLDVKPDKDGQRACIVADVVLKNSTALGANRCAKMVADCLATTAREVLAIEDLSTVRVNIKGVHVDAAETGRLMREQLAARADKAPAPVTAEAVPSDMSPVEESADAPTAENMAAQSASADDIKDQEDAITDEEEAHLTRLPDIEEASREAAAETPVQTVEEDKDALAPLSASAADTDDDAADIEDTLPPLRDDNEGGFEEPFGASEEDDTSSDMPGLVETPPESDAEMDTEKDTSDENKDPEIRWS